MNQIFLFMMLYFLIKVFYDYKYEQKNIHFKYIYNNSETKIISLLILEENNVKLLIITYIIEIVLFYNKYIL